MVRPSFDEDTTEPVRLLLSLKTVCKPNLFLLHTYLNRRFMKNMVG